MRRVVIDFDDRGHAVNQLSFAQNRWSIRANKQAGMMVARRGEGIKVLVCVIITTKVSKLVLLLAQSEYAARCIAVIQERRGNWRRIPWSQEKVIFVREGGREGRRQRPVVEHNSAHFK